MKNKSRIETFNYSDKLRAEKHEMEKDSEEPHSFREALDVTGRVDNKTTCTGKYSGGYIEASQEAYDLLRANGYKAPTYSDDTRVVRWLFVRDIYMISVYSEDDNVYKTQKYQQFYINNGVLSWNGTTISKMEKVEPIQINTMEDLNDLPLSSETIESFKVTEIKDNKYLRDCKGIQIDVYDVLKAFKVTNSATQHAIKKLLASGQRGYKDTEQDLHEAIKSIYRAIELEDE